MVNFFCYQESTKQCYNQTKSYYNNETFLAHLIFKKKANKTEKERPNHNTFNSLLHTKQKKMKKEMQTEMQKESSKLLFLLFLINITSHYKQIL